MKDFTVVAIICLVLAAIGPLLTHGRYTPLALALSAPLAIFVVGGVLIAAYNGIKKHFGRN